MGTLQLWQGTPGKAKQSNCALKNVGLSHVASKHVKGICLFQCTVKNKCLVLLLLKQPFQAFTADLLNLNHVFFTPIFDCDPNKRLCLLLIN